MPPAGRGGAVGRVGRATATARWLAGWPGAARRLARAVRRPGTHTVVNSLLALPVVRLARPVAPPTWLVHDVIVSTPAGDLRPDRHGRRARGTSPCPKRPPRRCAGSALTVQVRPNGVEWPVEPASTELHDPPVVGTLGLLTAWKGYGDLLDAVALLPAVRLELAGWRVRPRRRLRRRAAPPSRGARPGGPGAVPRSHRRPARHDAGVGRVRVGEHVARSRADDRGRGDERGSSRRRHRPRRAA